MMRRIGFALAVLVAALVIALLASRPPGPAPADAPADRFSAGRAIADIREISRAPRPTGSAENARVRAYLRARMRDLDVVVAEQAVPLPAESMERLRKWGGNGTELVNLIGIIPGRDPSKPMLLIMAHHDSVWASPGASDDAAGVASALEIARALKTGGQPERTVILLFTDAEELGLDGAESFFEQFPFAGRVGAVINMEARGGGGRAAMFETGRGNENWIRLYREQVGRPSSNSLAVLIYELMPNNTDFTIPKKLGLPGYNFAFIGRPELYHSPKATADAIDPGAVQDMGAQALAVARALAFSPDLPGPGSNAVFGDVLGLFVISYQPALGWLVLFAAAGLFAVAFVRARQRAGLTLGQVAGGSALALTFVVHSALLLSVVNLLSGSGGRPNYYDRLAALPRLELQAFLLCLAALVLACVAARPARRVLAAAPALLLFLVAILFGGWSPLVIGLAVAAAVTAMLIPARPVGVWDGWIGTALLLLVLGLAVQIIVPTAGPVLHWPLLLGGLAAALAAFLDVELRRVPALLVVGCIAALCAGQILSLAHFTFLGVGAGLPQVMALYALLLLMLLWPLIATPASRRPYQMTALILLIASVGVALSVRFDAIADTVSPYSLES